MIRDTHSEEKSRLAEALQLRELQLEMVKLLDFFDEICRDNGLRYSLIGGTLLGAVRHKGFIPWDDDADVCMPREDFEAFIDLCPRNCEKTSYALVGHPEPKIEFNPIIRLITRDVIVEDAYFQSQMHLWIDILPMDGMPDSIGESKKLLSRATRLRTIATVSYSNPSHGSNILKRFLKRVFTAADRNHRVGILAMHWLDQLARSLPFAKSRYIGAVTNGRYGIGERIPRREFENYTSLEFEGRRYSVMGCWEEYLRGVYGDYMKLPPVEQRGVHYLHAWRTR